MCLFLAELGLCYCMWAFSSCSEWGLLLIVASGLLTVEASHCECGGLSPCGARASVLHVMWDLPRPGIERVSPALGGDFLITGPPGKSPHLNLKINDKLHTLSILRFTFQYHL